MKNANSIFLVDGDFRRRAAISHCLADSTIHVEPFEDSTELVARWPRSGLLLVHDDGTAIADLLGRMGQSGQWLPVIGYAEAPTTRAVVQAVLDGAIDYIAWPFIREIRAWTPTTRLPRVPHYVAGVVNLRGTVLPVIDLAARLGWQPTEPTPRHAIIVTQMGNQACGLIVDAVSDIVTIADDALQPPPVTGNDSIVQFLEGLAAIDDKMVQVLNLAALGDSAQFGEAA